MATPSRPIDAYKALIDQLVNETSHSVTARIVVERGIFPETSANAVFNDLVRTLAPERRKLLGQMLNDERMGAIHDALAVLTWWISSQGLGLTFLGESMPVELSGAGSTVTISVAVTAGSGPTTAIRPGHSKPWSLTRACNIFSVEEWSRLARRDICYGRQSHRRA
jgi:hypothetical protein